MANEHVGVNLVEGSGINTIEGISTNVSGLIGTFERGPLNVATLVTNMADFENKFGRVPAPGVSTAYYSVKGFFRKVGSAPLWIVRVATSSAAAATLAMNDASVLTLTVNALNAGTWGHKVSVKTSTDSILATTIAANIVTGDGGTTLLSTEGLEEGSDILIGSTHKRLTAVNHGDKAITWAGTFGTSATSGDSCVSEEFKLEVYYNGVLVETHAGLGMNETTTFFVEKALISTYVTGTFSKATPANTFADLPAAAGPTVLASGDDGLATEETDYIGTLALKTGVYAFDNVPELFRFCCPNPLITTDPSTDIILLEQAMIAYADLRVTVQYYMDVPFAKTVVTALTEMANYVSRRVYTTFSWGKVTENKLTKWIPPSSMVIASAVEKDGRRGVHKSVGNEAVAYFTDLSTHISVAEGELLNNAGINTLRKLPGRGIRAYGGRTLSAETRWRFSHVSELWNYIGKSLEISTQDVPFEPHNQFLWKSVTRRISAFLATEHRKGSLFDASNPSSIPYSVVMNSTNNPAGQVALGLAKVDVEYVPVGTAEKFIINLTSSPTGLTINN